MLNFLKKIFQNEEQEAKKVIEISLKNLEDWLDEKSKPLMEEIRQQTEEILMKVNEELQRARINVEVLEHAKLQNPNIPFKAKQYMEGNRKAYIRAINSFLGHMEINNKDYYYLLDFCKQFDKMINDLNKGTLRSYTILQEFFANETNKIAQNLKNFDTLFTELNSVLSDKKMVAVNNAKEKIQNLKMKTKQKISLDVDFKNIEASLKLANDEKESTMAEIMDFSKSEGHNNFINLSEEKKSKEKEFFERQSQILQSFSILERPLRKYSHVAFEHEEIVLEYLNNPIEKLADDKELKIVEILKKLEKMLKENQIQIDEKKKEKAIEEINKRSKGFFEKFAETYFSFKSEISEIENKIKATGVANKLKEFNRRLEDANFSIEKNNEEYDRLKNDVTKMSNSIEALKGEIESSISDIFNEEIRVVV